MEQWNNYLTLLLGIIALYKFLSSWVWLKLEGMKEPYKIKLFPGRSGTDTIEFKLYNRLFGTVIKPRVYIKVPKGFRFSVEDGSADHARRERDTAVKFYTNYLPTGWIKKPYMPMKFHIEFNPPGSKHADPGEYEGYISYGAQNHRNVKKEFTVVVT